MSKQGTKLWLAADYHFPSTYSCRIPMSSTSSAVVTPAPGPSTVRLALIQTGIELFGLEAVQHELFPIIRSASVQIQPPERVAISLHRLRAHKWTSGKAGKQEFQESVILREMAHATEPLTVYIEVPPCEEERFRRLLQAVGYWGRTDSLTYSMSITQHVPDSSICVSPLRTLQNNYSVRQFFACVLTEFRDHRVTWQEIVPTSDTSKNQAFRLDVYVWPMIVAYKQSGSKLLVRHPFKQDKEEG
jgi:hypothetical protein